MWLNECRENILHTLDHGCDNHNSFFFSVVVFTVTFLWVCDLCVCFIFEMIAFLFDYISLVKYVPFSFVRLGATCMNWSRNQSFMMTMCRDRLVADFFPLFSFYLFWMKWRKDLDFNKTLSNCKRNLKQ